MGDPAVAGGASDGVPGAAAVGAPGGSAGDDYAGVRESDATRKDAVTTE
jgi:hypothetical protein